MSKINVRKMGRISKNLDELLNSQMSARDKTSLGYGTQLNEMSNNSETDSEISLSVFDVRSSDEESTPANDRFSKADGYHAVPPPITGNFLTQELTYHLQTVGKTNEANTQKPKTVYESVNRDKVIIEDWNSDDEDDVSEVQTVSPVKTNETQTVKTRVDKIDQTSQKQGIGFKKIKACFVCKSTDHLIKDCNFHDKQSQEPKMKTVVNTGPRVDKPVWDNTKRVNHQKISKYPHLRKTFVPTGVLTRTGLITHVKQNEKRAVHKVSTARPVSTARHLLPKIAHAANCCGQVLWIQNQMLDYGFNFMNTKIYIDNESTICIVKNPVFHSKTKHIEIRYHFIRDAYEKKLIEVLKIHTDDNVALVKWRQDDLLYSLDGMFREQKNLNNGDVFHRVIWLWTTAKSRTVNNISYIDAIVAGKPVTISEASIRSDLLFNDADGIDTLNNQAIFDTIQLMGYEGDLNILTFNKALFSPQWKFLFHTMNHCISSKSTSWDQIPTNIATAVICLATNQKYNFSKLIFDGMMRHLDASKKFVMYPRFLQIFLRNQLRDVPVPMDHFPVPALTKKVLSFMVKKGKNFSGNVTPLFNSMLVQPTEDEGEVSERPSEYQPIPSPTHPSEDQPEPQPDLSPRPSSSIPIPDSNPEGSGGNHGGQSSSDRSLSGNEDGLTLQSVYDLCISLCTYVTAQAAAITYLKAQIK
ncbi:hypothetical protein Tco_1408116 [Tanacetum coccineum]